MKRYVAVAVLLLATAARSEDAAALFQANCKMCHGTDGTGSSVGKALGVKDLTASTISAQGAAQVIENGRNKMIPFKGKLSKPQIETLATYVTGTLRRK